MAKKLKDWMTFSKSHRGFTIGALIVIVLLVSFAGYHFSHSSNAVASTKRVSGEQVTVATVSSLSPTNAPLSIISQVTSLNQATILAQAAGEIVTLDKKIGDQVYAGETIATIENSSQQAAVVQAQGAYDAANAALIKASGGTEGDTSDGTVSEDQSVTNTDASLAAVLQSAYVDLDDAVHTKSDVFFNYPHSGNPTLIQPFNAIDIELALKVEGERIPLEDLLARDSALTEATSSAQLNANISTMTTDAQTVESFLTDVSQAVNALQTANETANNIILPTATIAGYQTSITAARSEVATAITNLTGTLNTADTSGDEAQVEEAQGALDAAKAALAKTIITSPISGTIVDLSVTTGDYVTTSSEVAEVSNPNALKIVAHVSATDAKTLSVGNTATVNGSIQGTITQVSPAIDPQTGTIEVDVTLTGDQTGLTDGDSVTVDLNRTPSALVTSSTTDASSTASVIIPIVALKITPTGPEVFTVDSQKHTLVAHPVQIGSILGQDVVVTQGLTGDLVIVTDARGLVAGENVIIKKS